MQYVLTAHSIGAKVELKAHGLYIPSSKANKNSDNGDTLYAPHRKSAETNQPHGPYSVVR